MRVPMVDVRIVGMAVRQRLMPVRMGLRLARRVVGALDVLVAFVVNVGMGVRCGPGAGPRWGRSLPKLDAADLPTGVGTSTQGLLDSGGTTRCAEAASRDHGAHRQPNVALSPTPTVSPRECLHPLLKVREIDLRALTGT